MDTAATQSRENLPVRGRMGAPLGVFLLVAGAFIAMEHDYAGPKKFEMLVKAQSIEEFANLEQQLFQPRAWRQAGGLALGAFGLFHLLRRRRAGDTTVGFLAVLLLFFAGWSVLSLTWADDPALSFRRVALFALLALGAAGVAQRLTPRQILWLAALWSGAFLLLALGVEVAQGAFQPLKAGYRFAGTIHPNAQAVNCAILFLAAVHLMRGAQRGRMLLLLLAAAAIVFLYLTRSRTAFASVVAVLLVQWGIIQSRSMKVTLASAALLFAVFFLLLSDVLWPVAQRGIAMGREDASATTGTLTGRRQLWDQCLDFAAERPVLGYGYGCFWNESRSGAIIEKQGWPISHAHNAYLDVALDLGPAAAVAFVLILIAGITVAIAYSRVTGASEYAFFAMVLLFCALNGLLESVAIQRGQLTFLAMVILVRLAFFKAPDEAGVPGMTEQGSVVLSGKERMA
ncbi:MAG: O-antigen ligase family protein [Candidatus Hydrogenedentes bacterium]|nr:O-antigen ligase family protein [Candidatus Hydrogenedentota bacterium]